MTNFQRVLEFHKAFGAHVADKPELPPQELENMRTALIDEENTELHEALHQKDIVEVADALTDLLYVIYGFGLSCGIDLDKCFAEVHRTNMAKLGPDGKILKPEGWQKPDLSAVLYPKPYVNTCTARSHQYAGEPNCLHCGELRPNPTVSRRDE